MKITRISAKCFAGLRNCDVSLEDGLNIIYGKNETGKSTLVNLLAGTLFQSAKLDGRSDGDFKKTFFPSVRKGSEKSGADSIDGTVVFGNGDGEYRIEKVWGEGTSVCLSTPDGDTFRDAKAAESRLREALIYGEGVYRDILLSSQRNANASLENILCLKDRSPDKSRQNAKQEIVDAVSKALAESGGVSMDAIEKGIRKKIDELKENWDVTRDEPVPNRNNPGKRWTKNVGIVLQAYYDREDAREKRDELSKLDEAAKSALDEYREKEKALNNANRKLEEIDKWIGPLTDKHSRQETIADLEGKIEKGKEAHTDWPGVEEAIRNAKELQKKRGEREKLDLYGAVKTLREERDKEESRLKGMLCPEKREILDAKDARKKIDCLEGLLRGMNLSAEIRLLGDHGIEVRSVETGEPMEFSEHMTITEAVRITIPDVAEMVLAPLGTDAEAVRADIRTQKERLGRIRGKYGVETAEELDDRRREYGRTQDHIETLNHDLEEKLGDRTYETIEMEAKAVTDDPGSREEIEAAIRDVCGNVEIGTFIGRNEGREEGYRKDYGDRKHLEALIGDWERKQDAAIAEQEKAGKIPPELSEIEDPKKYLEEMKDDRDKKQDDINAAVVKKQKAINDRNDAYNEYPADDPEEEVREKERVFDEKHELLSHWLHIEKVFQEEKERLRSSPMIGLAEKFTEYLAEISDNRVVPEFPAKDNLDMNLYSGERSVDYNKLSEGTKETVFLAFRLAVLDHLFPDGGGIAVLDDPFVNMDADRTARSVELVKEFAKRHQVILLTCREEYRDMLGGNCIGMPEKEKQDGNSRFSERVSE